jgi:ferric-dicitrate binding protein FerR (iron transport regulator)
VQLRRTEDQPQSPLRSGAALLAGGEIATAADGRVLLGWVGGVEVRVDRASRVQIDSATALHLLEGAVYVDTRSSDENSAQLAILTSAGTVRHVGTRFEVRVAGGDTRVRVRDGTALFTGTDHAVVLIASGQQLSVADGQPSLVQGPGPADPAWEWTRAISPQFEIEGRSLYDSVEWLAHEAGLRIVYENGAVRDRAQGVIVHGNIAGLPTREALVAVLTGSGFEFVLDSDQVRIRATEDR